ncbi:MAG: radical SAM protein [Magnetococcales bacterium]|nr:radical SAM protein [Magnetococcales bacterium]
MDTQHVERLMVIATQHCNARCRGCDHWRQTKGLLDLESFRQVMTSLCRWGLRQVIFTGGECLLHPQLETMAAAARRQGLQVKVATNGLLLEDLKATLAPWVDLWTVSLDALDRATYARVRRLDRFDTIVGQLDALRHDGHPFRVSFLIQHLNVNQVADFVAHWHTRGAHSVSLLWPDFRGGFGNATAPGIIGDDFHLTPADIDHLARVELPRLVAGKFHEDGFLNWLPEEYDMIIDAMRANPGFPIRQTRCAVPYTNMVLHPDGQVGCCFHFPERFAFSPQHGPNEEGFRRLRNTYFFSPTLFRTRCAPCLQVTLKMADRDL